MAGNFGKGTNVGNNQMAWIYDANAGKATNEDYLLGKAVDKDYERIGHEGQINAVEYDCCPESIFSSQVDHQVDLQRKLQEDPLVSLRMKEVDTRKKILDNPIKMREINAYVSLMCAIYQGWGIHKQEERSTSVVSLLVYFIFFRLKKSRKRSTRRAKRSISEIVERKRTTKI